MIHRVVRRPRNMCSLFCRASEVSREQHQYDVSSCASRGRMEAGSVRKVVAPIREVDFLQSFEGRPTYIALQHSRTAREVLCRVSNKPFTVDEWNSFENEHFYGGLYEDDDAWLEEQRRLQRKRAERERRLAEGFQPVEPRSDAT